MIEFLEVLGGAMRALLDSKLLPFPLRVFAFLIGLLLLAVLAAFVLDVTVELVSKLLGT